MTQADTHQPEPLKRLRPTRRERRADRTRAEALSPVRILMRFLALPVVTGVVALSVYLRTSPYEPPQAMMHLVARTGCEAAGYIGLAPAYRGELGYHARNDVDGDGVACETAVGFDPVALPEPGLAAPTPANTKRQRMVGGAKFVRP